MTFPVSFPFQFQPGAPSLPYTLPYTLYFFTPPVVTTAPQRTCHVLNTVRSVSVLPNARTFLVPPNG
jgi:hypothetical protein